VNPADAILAETKAIIDRAAGPRDPFEAAAWLWRAWADAMFSFGHAMADIAQNARKGVIR
jgi:hypothetical protein